MAGTLIFPSPAKPAARTVQPIKAEHCPLCAAVFGKGSCQRGQHNNQICILTFTTDENGVVYFIVAPHFNAASVYSFSVLAQLDGTLYEAPLDVARQTLEHLGVSRNGGSPF